jgi:tol-pal system protein YbgF
MEATGQAPASGSMGPPSSMTRAELPPPSPAPGRRSDAFDPTQNPNAPGVPRTLGSISTGADPGTAQGAPLPPPGRGTQVSAVQPPSQSPRDEYDLAYGYLLRKDYDLAAQQFQTFLRSYPSDAKAGEAQFWLGESLFQRQNYHDAADAFLGVTSKYQNSIKAPDALLRLGQSLAAMGQKELACSTLGEVGAKYPRAPLNVKQGVEREQKRVHC